ncbi:MAG: aminotransferase class III-fold pyridoxal phosphate-dependent enzyme [Proteobacteria bacterium]|nr:aminotransferase class III-fold pyridoxal phosphate-dependent enzyme [Pseudomonadota bacterium]
MAGTDRSHAHFERARRVIPGGIQSNYRKSESHVPVYISHGRGARLFDLDGNEYIDYSLSYGPSILGHSNEHLRASIVRQAEKMYSNEVNALEQAAAEKIVAHVPCAELVRFACSGTEANYNALRIARAYTGRNMVVRFNGHYNGCLDQLIGGIVDDPQNPVPVHGERETDAFSQMGNTAGRAAHAFHDSYMIEWNDLDALSALLSRFGDDIAAVCMEPVMVNFNGCLPEPGYLEGVRELCTRYGVVLVFDEVLTGFRMGLGGAQGALGVIPDVATFAKAIGGGFPVSVFCGKREIMDVVTRAEVIAAGSYNGHPLAMAAVIATIEELEREAGAAFTRINALGNALADGLRDKFDRHGVPLILQGFPAAWTIAYSDRGRIINHRDSLAQGDTWAKGLVFSRLMNSRNVIVQARFCTSAAHTEQDVEETLRRADKAIAAFTAEAR